MPVSILKNIGFFIVFFAIFYLEQSRVLGIKFAYIWKFPLLFYMLYKIIKFIPKLEKAAFWGYLFCLKVLLTPDLVEYPFQAVILFLKYLPLPLFFHFFMKYYDEKTFPRLREVLVLLGSFILISVLPFLLGLINPITSGYDLEVYGMENSEGFIGIFQRPHGASICLSLALVVSMFFLGEARHPIRKIAMYGLLAVGTYALYQSFVRTGWIMFAVGFFFIYIYGLKGRVLIRRIPAMLVVVAALVFFYNTSEVFKMRITDKNIRTIDRQTEFIETFGSGRIMIARETLDIFYNSDFTAKLLGLGNERFMDEMNRKIGQRIFSHNGFLNILVTTGIIGMVLFLLFLYFLFISVHRAKKSKYRRLGYALFFMYIAFHLTQGGNNFLLELITMLGIVLVVKDHQSKIEKPDPGKALIPQWVFEFN